jgi:phosphate transport system permease protein
VIGETMVVLLCAGNRIAIPPLSDGLAVVFQPVHTMTGIIAQELGEVEKDGLHYHALFMVGLLLFVISLGINYFAQQVVRKFKISIG